jgi:3-hydroxybutyrate dehydrogenase
MGADDAMREQLRPLAGRRALVTGSSGGLGLAIASGLAREGCDIVLNGLAWPEDAEAARRSIETAFAVRALFHGADLSRPEEIENLAGEANEKFGGLDIVVNNAVVRQFGPIEQMPVAGWDQSIAVNLSAAFHTIRLALPGMRQRRFGRIVNVSSIYGLIGAANRADYVTTKTALIGLTRAVALETAEFDITCNAICPGTVPTPAITDRIRGIAASSGVSEGQATSDYLSARQPSGRFIDGGGVASLVAYLCGEGGRDITGAALPIDGGWSIA